VIDKRVQTAEDQDHSISRCDLVLGSRYSEFGGPDGIRGRSIARQYNRFSRANLPTQRSSPMQYRID
jgi:hypothetical protein